MIPFNQRGITDASNCITPAGGFGGPSTEDRSAVKQTDPDQPVNPPRKNDFNLLLESMKPTGTESLQVAHRRWEDQKQIKSGLSRMLSADIDKMMEEAQREYNASPENRMKDKVTKKNKALNHSPGTFHQFKDLPDEIRIIIWGMAIPKLFEAVAHNQQSRFITAGPRDAILGLLHNYHKIFFMSPIFIPRQNDTSIIQPVYIRPSEDILYLNTEALYALDIPVFIGLPENQVIENIALPVVPMERIRWCGKRIGRDVGTRTWLGDLVRGLNNLKTIYVVEGHTLHNEGEVDYYDSSDNLIKYSLGLEDLKTAKQTKDWSPPSQSYCPPAKPWNEVYKETVEKAFMDELEREKSGKYDVIFEKKWNVPEIVCKELKRVTWRETAQPQHWQREDPFSK
jgi:hypothetical protein